MNGKIKPHSQTSKYLGMTLDAKLRWKVHVKEKKRKACSKTQTHVLAYGKAVGHVNTSTHNKLVLYKQILKPAWNYGIKLWGCTKPSNIVTTQRFQDKVLRNIADPPWYVRKADLHRDPYMEMVTAEIRRFARKHEGRLLHHDNVEAIQLLENSELLRRLKRKENALVWFHEP
jgi:hypothetical protein